MQQVSLNLALGVFKILCLNRGRHLYVLCFKGVISRCVLFENILNIRLIFILYIIYNLYFK